MTRSGEGGEGEWGGPARERGGWVDWGGGVEGGGGSVCEGGDHKGQLLRRLLPQGFRLQLLLINQSLNQSISFMVLFQTTIT